MIFYKISQWVKDKWRGNLLGGIGRSNQWDKVRKDFLIIHDTCAICGKKKDLLKSLEVHHITPFSVDKSLELDSNNLIVYCRDHHLLFGHLNSWKSFNKNVRIDSEVWREKIKNRP